MRPHLVVIAGGGYLAGATMKRGRVRHTEFWDRMERALGPTYARSWARSQVISGLGGRTVEEALAEGEDAKRVWREVWRVLELPPRDR